MSHRVVVMLSLVLVMTVWASAVTVTKAALDQVPPITFALLRFAVASALLLLVAFRRRERVAHLDGRTWGTIAGMGLCGITLYYFCSNLSLVYATASQGVIIQGAIPVITAVLAVFVLRERPSPKRILGIVLSLVGVVLVVIVAAPSANASNPLLGGVLMLGAVIAWAFYTILAKRVATADQLSITAWSTTIGTALLIPLALFELRGVSLAIPSASNWIGIVYLGAVSTAGGHLLYNRSLAHLEASQAATFINLIPLIGVAIAVIFLGEVIVGWQFLGGALVLLGVWLAT